MHFDRGDDRLAQRHPFETTLAMPAQERRFRLFALTFWEPSAPVRVQNLEGLGRQSRRDAAENWGKNANAHHV